MYLFPTIFRFDENMYKFTVLPNSSVVVNVEPIN
jgi:hypothetical protein